MGAFRDALAQLSALTVSGIVSHYAFDAVPDSVARAQLPALLVLPLEQERGLFADRGEGLTRLGFSGGGQTAAYSLTHLLLAAPLVGGSGAPVIAALVDLVDAYLRALAAQPLLGGTLSEPPEVRVEVGAFTHGGVRYAGCAFRHRWQIRIAP
jgi:hypothetical protein